MLVAGGILENSVEYLDAYVDEALNRIAIPPHLVLLRHSFRDDLVDCVPGESGGDARSLPMPFAVILDGVRMRLQVSSHTVQCVTQPPHGRNVLKRFCVSPLSKGYLVLCRLQSGHFAHLISASARPLRFAAPSVRTVMKVLEFTPLIASVAAFRP